MTLTIMTHCQTNLKCTKGADILLSCFFWSCSLRIGNVFLPHFLQMFPAWIATLGVKSTVGNNGGKGLKPGWQKSGSPFPCARGIIYSVYCCLTRLTKHDYKHLPLLSKPTRRETMGDITLLAPAVKHAKANHAMKQIPETHTLASNLCTLKRRLNTKTKTSASLHIYKKEIQFFSLAA